MGFDGVVAPYGLRAGAREMRSVRPMAHQLRYDARGEGPPLVLVHGHPFDRRMWAPQVEELVGSLPDPAVVRLPGVGHLPNLEAPDAFDAALRSFAAGAVR